jgi:hypothetical protein
MVGILPSGARSVLRLASFGGRYTIAARKIVSFSL